MTQKYNTVRIKSDIIPLLENAEKLYRYNHSEFDKMNLSKSKILYEVLFFYLKGSKYEVKRNE